MMRYSWAAAVVLLLAIPFSGAEAQLGIGSRFYYVVASGGSVRVAAYTILNPDCSSVGDTSASLVQAPQGGEVSIEPQMLYPSYPKGNARFQCDRRKVRHMAIVYRANPGFVGTDTFSAELLFPGGLARTVRWTVSVRPANGA